MLSFDIFFFTDTASTEIYTLSLHDALPILLFAVVGVNVARDEVTIFTQIGFIVLVGLGEDRDRKSTRLNSSHTVISYAVFCLKKKKFNRIRYRCLGARARRAGHADGMPALG